MSIELSVVVNPSRKLQILRILFSVCLLLIALYLACSTFNSVILRFFFAASCLLTALFNYLAAMAAFRNRWHILINGKGEIRCKPLPIDRQSSSNSTVFFQQAWNLVPGSVIWPQMLLLRLRTLGDDNMINLMILSDAVSTDEFRRLSIACRWIVAKANSVQE